MTTLIKRGVEIRRRIAALSSYDQNTQQLQVLKRLLYKAGSTSFGTHYQFQKILKSPYPMALFQEQVPIFDYDKIYNEWWYRCIEGEPNVCWPQRIKYFALSSGTSGAPSKYIPLTDDMLWAMRTASAQAFFNLATFDGIDDNLYRKSMLMIGSTISLTDKGLYQVGDLSGINASRVPRWFRPYYKPGFRIARLPNYEMRIAEIAKNAHKWDIGGLSGIPSWVQLMLERVIEYHNLHHIHEIWPNLQVYATGGVAFEPYRKGFEKLLGRPLVYFDTYLASEGFMAFQERPHPQGAMKLILNRGIFFEFVPFDEHHFTAEGELLPHAKAIGLADVATNVDYALVISTCAGAWRYLIGDTVRFVDKQRAEIIITGRVKHFLSICGEHLSVDNMNQAILQTSEKLGVVIREYTVSAIENNARFGHKWYIGCDDVLDKNLLLNELDKNICALNDDYAVERKSVLDMEVVCVPTQIFYDWCAAIGKMGGQAKIPRVLKKDKFAQWEEFVRQKGF